MLAVIVGCIAWFASRPFYEWANPFFKANKLPENLEFHHLFLSAILLLGLTPSLLAITYGKLKNGVLNLLLSTGLMIPLAYVIPLVMKVVCLIIGALLFIITLFLTEQLEAATGNKIDTAILITLTDIGYMLGTIATLFITQFSGFLIQKKLIGKAFLPPTGVFIFGSLLGGCFLSFNLFKLLMFLGIFNKSTPPIKLPFLEISATLTILPMLLLWAWQARKEK